MTSELMIPIETDEDLRGLVTFMLSTGKKTHIPTQRIWGKIEPGARDGKCPSEIGDGRKALEDCFYITSVDSDDYMSLGHDHTNPRTGVATGAFKALTSEEFWNAVDYVGVENLFIELPSTKEEVLL